METNNYKSKVKDLKYEFECPDCGCDLLLAFCPVIYYEAFAKVTKITCLDEEDNVVDTLYGYSSAEQFDIEDTDEPMMFQCHHCKKTWTFLEDMIDAGIIKLEE